VPLCLRYENAVKGISVERPSSALELEQDVLWQWCVKVIGNDEFAGTQADWSRLLSAVTHWPDLRNRLLVPYDRERFARLDSPQVAGHVLLDLLLCHRCHSSDCSAAVETLQTAIREERRAPVTSRNPRADDYRL
jgi:hypothetical protein